MVVEVGSPYEFMAALQAAVAPGAPNDTILELTSDVTLTEEAAANYSLPFHLEGGHTLTLATGEHPRLLMRVAGLQPPFRLRQHF